MQISIMYYLVHNELIMVYNFCGRCPSLTMRLTCAYLAGWAIQGHCPYTSVCLILQTLSHTCKPHPTNLITHLYVSPYTPYHIPVHLTLQTSSHTCMPHSRSHITHLYASPYKPYHSHMPHPTSQYNYNY